MSSRIDNIRIATIGNGVPILLIALLVVGLSASGVLLDFMGEVKDKAQALHSSSVDLSAVLAGLDSLDGLLKGASALFALFLSFLAGFFYWFTRFRLLKPIIELQGVMSRLAVGDNAQVVPRQDQQDEIGAMARSLEVFKRHAVELESMSVIKSEKEQEIAHKRRMIALADALEGEVHGTVTDVVEKAEGMHTAANNMSTAIGVMGDRSRRSADASEEASANVEAVATATEQLVAASREIATQMERTTTITRTAVGQAQEADTTMRELARVSEEIGDVLKVINTIAAQTNLLALNATIEAARAGEAGKGFAVVAGEVKALATQTARAVDSITSQITSIRSASERSAEAIGSISGTISEIDDIAAAVAVAIDQQQATISEISRNAHGAADRTGVVSEAVGDIVGQVGSVGSVSQRVEDNSHLVTDKLHVLESRLNAVLRQSLQGTAAARHDPVSTQGVKLRMGGQSHPVTLREMTMDHAAFDLAATGVAEQMSVDLLLPEFGPLKAVVVGRQGGGWRIAFDLDNVAKARLGEYLFGNEALDQPYIAKVQDVAGRIAQCFEEALKRGELTMAQLFDENYQPIPNTNPEQFLTQIVPFTDRMLPTIQEPVLTALPGIAFCAAVDRNGYLPTHNLRVSKPQGTDPAWNAANCRNRRFFVNFRELAAARNTKPYLLQSYLRDLGGGTMAILRDASAPIMVNGRHWGGVRMGYDI